MYIYLSEPATAEETSAEAASREAEVSQEAASAAVAAEAGKASQTPQKSVKKSCLMGGRVL